MGDPKRIIQRTDGLFEAWCDRRCARALRELLAGYPVANPLTDGWGELLSALEAVRAFAGDELTDAEQVELGNLIADTTQLLADR